MAHAVDSRASSPANALRDALDEVEDLVVKPNAQTIERLLIKLDEINAMLVELGQTNIDLRPELVRWEGVRSRVSSNPGAIVSAAAAVGGLAKLREKHPPAENFWRHLDKEVARQRLQTVRRLAIVLGSIVGVVLIVYFVLETFFPPSPDTLLMLDTNQNVEERLRAGDLAGARRAVEAGLEQLPNEPELWIWDVTLSEMLGDDERAQRSLARAQEILADQPVALWVTLGNQRLQLGNLEGAEAAAQRVIELDPDEAQGYFLLANVAELSGDYPEAIDMFEKTFQLAEDDNPQLAVISRVRLGTLLQRANPFETPGQSSSAAPAGQTPESQPTPDAAPTPTLTP